MPDQGFVDRPRLEAPIIGLLRQSSNHGGSVILISAPAGAGKTVLLSSVLRSLEVGHSRGAVSAWLDVRDRDNNASVLCANINGVLARALRDVAGTARVTSVSTSPRRSRASAAQ